MNYQLSGNNFNQRCIVHSINGISRCIVGCGGTGGYHAGNEPKVLYRIGEDDMENTNKVTPDEYRIRKLTPRECWRLMAFPDECFDRASDAKISNTQLYKQAGNSIVVDVLYYIYKNLYDAMPYLFDDLKLCSLFSGIGAPEVALDKLYESIGE